MIPQKIIFITILFLLFSSCRKEKNNNMITTYKKDSIEDILNENKRDEFLNDFKLELNKVEVEENFYKFMEIVIKEEGLDRNYNIRTIPASNTIKSDYDFLYSILEEEKKFSKIEPEIEVNSEGDTTILFAIIPQFSMRITNTDMASMIKSKELLSDFTWDNSRLGFNSNNNKEYYSFSIPLLNKEVTKGIVTIEYKCDGFMCGGGKHIMFAKENEEWGTELIDVWYH